VRRWRRLLALAVFALAAIPAANVRAYDEPPPPVEGPWVIEVAPDATIIVDEQGNVVMTGGAPEEIQRCELEAGCAAFWDDGIGAAVIVSPADVAVSAP